MAAMHNNSDPSTPLNAAQLEWRDGQPWASAFDDIYYSRDGRSETDYVFLQQNRLEQRWSEWHSGGDCFVIAETGFGSGLNFLLAAQLFLARAPSSARLQFVSTELHPMRAADLRRATAFWQAGAGEHWLAEQLLANYPPLVAGQHTLQFADGRIQLQLLFGDALTALQQLCVPQGVDAWFLDGFAPAKNATLWQPALYPQMAALSAPGATFATFTAAGDVRRGLTAAGFDVHKIAGFAGKRDMLKGALCDPPSTDQPTELPWFLGYPSRAAALPRSAVIVGAGIAGCSAANALAQRGYQVTVIDRHRQPAQAGSGNRQAVVYPKLSLRDDQLPQINLAALLFASRYYQPHWQAGRGQQCGVMVLPQGGGERDEMAAIAARHTDADWIEWLDSEQLQSHSGLALGSENALWFNQLGWLQPQAVCSALLDHANIEWLNADIEQCQFDTANQQWQLYSAGKPVAAAAQMVIAAGVDSARFGQSAELPFKPIRGQVSHLHSDQLGALPRCVICAQGYIAPAHQQLLTLGASYRRDRLDSELSRAEHQHNLAQLGDSDRGLQQLLGAIEPEQLAGRANCRATTPDYLPLVGAVPDAAAMLERYAFLGRDAKQVEPLQGAYQPNLFMLAGLGSRGFSYAPLMSELLASQMCGDPAPLPRALCNALHPARFIIRDLKRNRLARYSALRSDGQLV